ncbi:hypothetical protein [Frisingicoccus sp.]|uniref:hypothetical protein n=1 Tax=Frisingicoccus sp. TaxID=1918627 RepID=UPI00399C09C0
MRKLFDYDTIFDIYELKNKNKEDRDRIRQNIRRKWKSYLKELGKGNTDWNGLEKTEQDRFIYYEIRDILIREHTENNTKKRIDSKIQKAMSDSLLEAERLIEAENDRVINVWKRYWKEGDPLWKIKRGYEQFCKDMTDYNNRIPLPTFEEFQIAPLRIYDYVQDLIHSSDDGKYVDISMVNDVLIRIILQVLEEKLNLKIDRALVQKALRYTQSFNSKIADVEQLQFEEFYPEYSEDFEMTKEEFESEVKKLGEYYKYKRMLQNLKPFYNHRDIKKL